LIPLAEALLFADLPLLRRRSPHEHFLAWNRRFYKGVREVGAPHTYGAEL
jgi:hypothetical protein